MVWSLLYKLTQRLCVRSESHRQETSDTVSSKKHFIKQEKVSQEEGWECKPIDSFLSQFA